MGGAAHPETPSCKQQGLSAGSTSLRATLRASVCAASGRLEEEEEALHHEAWIEECLCPAPEPA